MPLIGSNWYGFGFREYVFWIRMMNFDEFAIFGSLLADFRVFWKKIRCTWVDFQRLWSISSSSGQLSTYFGLFRGKRRVLGLYSGQVLWILANFVNSWQSWTNFVKSWQIFGPFRENLTIFVLIRAISFYVKTLPSHSGQFSWLLNLHDNFFGRFVTFSPTWLGKKIYHAFAT